MSNLTVKGNPTPTDNWWIVASLIRKKKYILWFYCAVLPFPNVSNAKGMNITNQTISTCIS